MTFQHKYLSPTELVHIEQLSEGEFNNATLQKLLMKMDNIFDTYTPDKTVMSYMHQHASSLNWKHELDFRHPNERTRDTNTNVIKSKPTRLKEKSSSKRLKSRMPKALQCRHPKCQQKGTHTTHKHSDCIYRTTNPKVTNPKHQSSFSASRSPHRHKSVHPNLGKAPIRDKSHSKSVPHTANNSVRSCYICNSDKYLANTCPNKGHNKALAKARLKNDVNFMAQWQETFTTEAQQQCAQRIVDAYDHDNVCPRCLQVITYPHQCHPNDNHIIEELSTVRNLLSQSTMLDDIRLAHNPSHDSTHSNNEGVSVNSNFFFVSGGEDSDTVQVQTSMPTPAQTPSPPPSHEDKEFTTSDTQSDSDTQSEQYISDVDSLVSE